MFDKKITIELPQEIILAPLGKNNLIFLRTKENLSEHQYTRLKDQFKDFKIGDAQVKLVLLEGGIFVDSVIVDD